MFLRARLLPSFLILLGIVSIFRFDQLPQVQAFDATCLDIVGSAPAVAGLGGMGTAGGLSFNKIGGAPSDVYEGCMRDTNGGTPDGKQLEGFAWLANVGWMSLYCPAGLGQSNMGVSCTGSYTLGYGVTMPSDATGLLRGHAWGDNVGWIAFNCLDTSSCAIPFGVKVETDPNPACLGRVYGSVKPDPACPNHTVADTMAWSSSLGWINLDGLVFPMGLIPTVNMDVFVRVMTDGSSGAPISLKDGLFNLSTMPVADGNQGYQVEVFAQDKVSSVPIPLDPANFDVTFNLVWDDTVGLNQTDAVVGGGAVTKPLALTYDAGTGTWKGKVSSVAPTSDVNGLDTDADGTIDYQYQMFNLPQSMAAPALPDNHLRLTSLAVSVEEILTTACAFGDDTIPGNCDPEVVDYDPLDGGVATNLNLPFRPAVEVSTLLNEGANYISALVNTPESFETAVTCRGGYAGACNGAQVYVQYGVDMSPSDYKFVADDTNGDGTIDANDDDFVSNSAAGFPSSLLAIPVLVNPTSYAVNNPYVWTRVSYNASGNNVVYYSNKLPRVSGNVIYAPQVKIVGGDVYSTTITNVQADSGGNVVRSLGNQSTNEFFNKVYKSALGIVRGLKASSTVGTLNSPIQLTTDGNDFVGDPGVMASAVLDQDGKNKVYYLKGDVVIGNSASQANLTWTGNKTLVVEGGNVFIDQNLYNSLAPGTIKPQLGIIVLRDSNSGSRISGNVFVHPNVTDLQAHIAAERSIQSYSGDLACIKALPGGYDNEGYCDFGTYGNMEKTLLNQLRIEGSVSSWNTINGSVATPKPIFGSGRVASTATDMLLSKQTDMTYLRFYGPVFKRDPVTGEAEDIWPDGQIIALLFDDGGDLVLPEESGDPFLMNALRSQAFVGDPAEYNAVTIEFVSPSASLPGFNFSEAPAFSLGTN